jgi:hypothetical protein
MTLTFKSVSDFFKCALYRYLTKPKEKKTVKYISLKEMKTSLLSEEELLKRISRTAFIEAEEFKKFYEFFKKMREKGLIPKLPKKSCLVEPTPLEKKKAKMRMALAKWSDEKLLRRRDFELEHKKWTDTRLVFWNCIRKEMLRRGIWKNQL